MYYWKILLHSFALLLFASFKFPISNKIDLFVSPTFFCNVCVCAGHFSNTGVR